jgi:hypothetical protein
MSTTTSAAFTNKLAPFAQNAWSRFPSSGNRRMSDSDLQEKIESWARQEARTYFHIAARQYPFVRIYSALVRYANVQIGLQEQRNVSAPPAEALLVNCGRTRHSVKPTTATIRVTKSPEVYEKKLEAFAQTAWTRYNSQTTDIANWARQEARDFYHLCNGAYPFISAWRKLSEYGETCAADEDRAEQRQEVAAKATRDFRKTSEARTTRSTQVPTIERDANLVTPFVEDGQQTAAEERAGRAELNRILFREHTIWWDAFEAEAAEDMEEHAADATDRFSWHCARLISRRTGLRQEIILPVVGAWLIVKAA